MRTQRRKRVRVTRKELHDLQTLAQTINDPSLPQRQRHLAQVQYEALIRHTKARGRVW